MKPNSDAMPQRSEAGDRYQLSGEIARGGMGAVLSGRDVDLGRDLAVKVLLEKHAHRPEIARRFIEEAQIGGQLQHPGVVPVYDIGRFGDRPFFTMKLVKGLTLSAIHGDRTGASADRPRLLSIALQVVQALAYAHAKGVIHRDLKPANIMVGAFGEVQVMDWGLAKVLAEGGVADEMRASRAQQVPEDVTTIRTARSSGSPGSYGTDTEAGSLLGTPAYMPPEQANGDMALLDRRADVFGLGAILCEILTGKAPYVGRSGEEVRRKACNGDLADAMARLDACGADQELIVLTKACLAPETIDRPKDAQAVADGLTTYLNGVQERLHQAELAEAEAKAKAAEEAKRRRLTLALAATVLLALTLGGGGWLWVKAEHDARLVKTTRDVNEAVNKATALRAQAQAAPVSGALLFSQAREQVQRALALVESGPVDAALAAQLRALQVELDDEEKDRKLVTALDEARLAQADLGNQGMALERAVPLFREALRAYGLPAGEGGPQAACERIRQRPEAVREALAATLDEWIDLLTDPSRNLAEPHLDWLRAVTEAIQLADGWTRQFRSARNEADAARRLQAFEELADAADVRLLPPGALTRLAKQFERLNAWESQVRLLQRAREQNPADFWINHDLGNALIQVRPAQKQEAVRFLTAAVALRPDSPGAHISLGIALGTMGRWDEAVACYRKAVAIAPNYAGAHNNLGVALSEEKRWDEAVACYRKAIEIDPGDWAAHLNLGNVTLDEGRWDEAIASYRKAIEIDPSYALGHTNLGNALLAKGLLNDAIACFNQSIAIDSKSAGAQIGLGIALNAEGRLDEAIACFEKAVDLDPKNAVAHYNLGDALFTKGRPDMAKACFLRAIDLNPKYADAHNNLGNALKAEGKLDEAKACYLRAIDFNPKYSFAHTNLGIMLQAEGKLDEAIASHRKAIEFDSKHAPAHSMLGIVLKHKGQVDEAIACQQKAIELDPKLAEAHCNLGAILCDVKRDHDGAIACFRTAIELNPKFAFAHANLGVALRDKGQLDEAIASFRKAVELAPEDATIRTALAHVERLAAAGDKFADFQDGSYTPASNEERLSLVEWCQFKRLHQTATDLYAAVFAADQQLADDRQVQRRYHATCAAALAAAGQGEDAAKLDDAAKAKLRAQALDWLKSELAVWDQLLESGPPQVRPAIMQTLKHWQSNPELAGLRDAAELAKFPVEEKKAFTKLWADVAGLLKKVAREAGQP